MSNRRLHKTDRPNETDDEARAVHRISLRFERRHGSTTSGQAADRPITILKVLGLIESSCCRFGSRREYRFHRGQGWIWIGTLAKHGTSVVPDSRDALCKRRGRTIESLETKIGTPDPPFVMVS
jgi:hypothetical protein